MSEEKHWEAGPTSYRLSMGFAATALSYCNKPGGTKHPDGTTTLTMRFPALILSEYVSEQEKVAEQIAGELNLMHAMQHPRPIAEYHEDMGTVMWWCWRDGGWLGEAPYVGCPSTLGSEVNLLTPMGNYQCFVGGWPGYHTHFTPLPPIPNPPAAQVAEPEETADA